MPPAADDVMIDLAADSDSEEEDDGVIDLSAYVFTSDEEDSDGGEDSGSELEVEWELEIAGEVAAPQRPAGPPAIDLTADSEEDDDGAAPPAARPPLSRKQRRRQQREQQKQQRKQRGKQRKQQTTQEQQQRRHAERQAEQLFAVGGSTLTVFTDGSHRPRLKAPLLMSAGVWCQQHKLLQSSWLLQGGTPDSTRAELGAVFAGAARLKMALEGQLIRKPEAVHILTDCKSCVSFLMPGGAAVKAKYEPLVTATRARLQELRELLPVTLRWVKGHQTGHSFEAVGNNAAHRLAKHCDAHSAVCQLPVAPVAA